MNRNLMRGAIVLIACLPSAALAQSAPPPPPPTVMPSAPPPSPPAVAPTSPPPPACATVDYRAFDFWIGEWDVFSNGAATQVATSSIESMFGGCVIRETWKPARGSGGGSFSHFDSERGYWRQAWVDGSGSRVDFDGGATDGKMVLTGYWANVIAPGQGALIRMTYTTNPDKSVRQHGEQSVDHGLNWTTSFDFIYKPQKPKKG